MEKVKITRLGAINLKRVTWRSFVDCVFLKTEAEALFKKYKGSSFADKYSTIKDTIYEQFTLINIADQTVLKVVRDNNKIRSQIDELEKQINSKKFDHNAQWTLGDMKKYIDEIGAQYIEIYMLNKQLGLPYESEKEGPQLHIMFDKILEETKRRTAYLTLLQENVEYATHHSKDEVFLGEELFGEDYIINYERIKQATGKTFIKKIEEWAEGIFWYENYPDFLKDAFVALFVDDALAAEKLDSKGGYRRKTKRLRYSRRFSKKKLHQRLK